MRVLGLYQEMKLGNVVDYSNDYRKQVALALVQSLYGRFGSHTFLAQNLVTIGPTPSHYISPKKPAGDHTTTQSTQIPLQ
jgi:hypothetical protein